jgi:hypothetical protein
MTNHFNFNSIQSDLACFLLFCTILYHIFLNMSSPNFTMLSSFTTMLSFFVSAWFQV